MRHYACPNPECEHEVFTVALLSFTKGCAQTLESPAEADELELQVEQEECSECGHVLTDAEQEAMTEAEEEKLSEEADDEPEPDYDYEYEPEYYDD